MKIKKIFASFLALAVSTLMLIPCNAISLGEITIEEDIIISRKISSELAEIIKTSDENELIPIYIFRNLISEETINKKLLLETGMNADIYENSELYETVLIPQIENSISYTSNLNSTQAIENAASAEINRFLSEKRNIVKQEYELSNAKFIENNIINTDNIVYMGTYTSTIALEATPNEIKEYAKLKDVEEIAYFDDVEQEVALDVVLPQVGADSVNGTKSSNYNSGAGYKGKGIKIGIMEASSGKYNATSPYLKGISGTQLTYVYNYTDDKKTSYVKPTVTEHATLVTAVVVGQAVTINNITYEGVAPEATVYQTSVKNASSVYTGFSALVDKGVNLINYSGGSDETGYSAYNKEIDNLIATTKVTFVAAAGNSGGNVYSPAKSYNSIAVGAVTTKSNNTTASNTPYSMRSKSSYIEESYLPNKPDISAPGTNITFASTSTDVINRSGTSYAAPIITGVLAQSMQRVPYLKTSPYVSKAAIMLFADASKISTTDNPAVGGGLRDKSGAGLIDAKRMLKAFTMPNSILKSDGATYNTTQVTYKKGQKVRVALVFGKNNDISITKNTETDNLDLKIYNSSGTIINASASTRNNIEIVEFTVPADGTYYFQVYATKVQNTTNGVPFAVCYMVV